MAHRIWVAKIAGAAHRIEIEHDALSGRRAILVDGLDVHRERRLLDLGDDFRFAVSGEWAVIRVAPSGLGYRYRLALNDVWTDDWTAYGTRPRSIAIAGAAFLAHAATLVVLATAASMTPESFLELVGTRVLVAAFLALQVLGGVRWSWYAALAYAAITGAAVLLAAAGPASLDASAWPGDLRSGPGLLADALFTGVAAAALRRPSARAFFFGARPAPSPAAS